MKKIAVEQARDRLERARTAFLALPGADTFRQFKAHWTDFLLAATGVYTKLEQAAKGEGPHEAWFGRKKHERKKDPLLSYLHHARNVDEHGIAPVTRLDPGSISIAGRGDYEFSGVFGSATSLTVTHHGGPSPQVLVSPPIVRLVPAVDDRYHDKFDPPASHLGKNLTDTTPSNVARLMMIYLEAMVVEAEVMAGLRPSSGTP